MRLTQQARQELRERTARGEASIDAAWSKRPRNAEDREAAASDVVVEVLTALFGPAGSCKPGGPVLYNEAALLLAEGFLGRALRAYRGDAEDYVHGEEVA